MVGDGIVSGAGCDGIDATIAVDRIGARTGRNDIVDAAAGNGQRRADGARIDVFEACDGNRIARGLVCTGTAPEIDRSCAARRGQHEHVDARAAVNGGFRSVVGDRVIACARSDHVRSATAIEGVGSRTAGDGVDAR